MRTSWRHSLFVVFASIVSCALACSLTACTTSDKQQTITVAGSTTVLPIAEIAAEKFAEQQQVNVLVSGLGSSAGIEAAINGTADIASSSRDLTKAESDHNLVKIPIAHDGIAVIVNTQNHVMNLTKEQLKQIYSGEITNWKQLGGKNQSILVVNRDEASGTREAFKKIVMGDSAFLPSAAVLPGTGQVRDVVSRTPGAIGYISIGFVDTPFAHTKVKPLSIDGIVPNETTVSDMTYPISRDLYFFTKDQPSGKTQEFISFVLSDSMHKVIREAGYLPISDQGATSGSR